MLLPLAGVSIWTRNILLDTDRYVSTVGPLATNTAIVDRATTLVSDRINEKLDVQSRVKAVLPGPAAFLAAPIAEASQRIVDRYTRQVLESKQFATIWNDANRRAHKQVEALLTGDSKVASIDNGKVVLDLSQVLTRVKLALQAKGIGILDKLPINKIAVRFELFKAPQLAHARAAIKLLKTTSYALVIGGILCLLAAVALFPDRRKGWLRVGLGVAFVSGLLWIGVGVGRSFYVGAVAQKAEGRPAVTASFDIITHYFRNGVRTVFVIGLVIALAAWLAGTGYAARKLQGAVGSAADRAAGLGRPNLVGEWIAAHRAPTRTGIIGLGVIGLTLVDHPTGADVLVATALVLVALLVAEVLARGASRGREELSAA